MRMVVAAPMDMTIMKAQLPSVMAIWLALSASLLNQPIMMPVPTKAEASRNICEAMGSPMRSSARMSFRARLRSEKPFR